MSGFSSAARSTITLIALISSCAPGWHPPQVDLAGAPETTRRRVADATEVAAAGGSVEVAALGDLYLALGYPEAARQCYDLAAENTGESEHWLLAATAATDTGDSVAARERFEAALAADPAAKTPRLALADLNLESGDLEAASREYRRVLEQAGADPRATLGLARTALAAGEAREAAARFRQVLDLRPHANQVRTGLAEAYRLMGRPDLARVEQQRAGPGEVMSDDPALARVGRLRVELVSDTVVTLAQQDDTTAADVAGFAVAQLGAVPTAARRLAELAGATNLSPSAAQRLWFAVGMLAERQGELDAAIDAYGQALQHGPDVASQLRLGRALLRLDRFDEAEESLAASGVDAPDVLRDRALALRRSERPAEAAQLLQRGIESAEGPESDRMHLDLAETLAQMGRLNEAERIYNRLTISDDSLIAATSWARLGSMAADRGREDRAAAAFQQAVEAQPDWLAPRYALAATWGRLGRYEDAGHEYRQILARQPAEEQAWLGVATAVGLSQGAEAARRVLEQGLEALPDSAALQSAVEKVGL